MNDIQAQLKKQDETISLLRGLLEQMRAERVQASTSQANFNLNAGGAGVWIATTACLIAVTCCGFMAIISVDHGRRIDRLDDYISSIFQQVPSLRAVEDAKKTQASKAEANRN